MSPSQITDTMMEKDYFSQWLGIERVEEGIGHCTLRMKIREEMCNGFGTAHGGISYSLADTALAFASNSHGRHAVSIETTISHIKPLVTGDIIIATAKELSATNNIAIYEVKINREDELVALFKGIVYKKKGAW